MMTMRLSRRRVLTVLGGIGNLGPAGAGCSRLPAGAGAVSAASSVATQGPGVTGESPDGPGASSPVWTDTMPHGRPAYTSAPTRLDLVATLPCYCGCGVFRTGAHASLKDCFVTLTGEIVPHAGFCEACQDEAIDAATWADAGLTAQAVHAGIVAAYPGRGSATRGEHG
jgi:hypothetical protein